jgi:hypothetical protein
VWKAQVNHNGASIQFIQMFDFDTTNNNYLRPSRSCQDRFLVNKREAPKHIRHIALMLDCLQLSELISCCKLDHVEHVHALQFEGSDQYLSRKIPGAACAAEHDKTYMCIFTIWSEMHMQLASAMSELTAAQ